MYEFLNFNIKIKVSAATLDLQKVKKNLENKIKIVEIKGIKKYKLASTNGVFTPDQDNDKTTRQKLNLCINTLLNLKGIYTPAGSLTFSNSGLPDHHSYSMTLDAYHIDSVNTCYD